MSFFDPIAKAFWRNKYLDVDAYQTGYDSGVSVGKEQGHKEEYDTFWDAFQMFGANTDYMYAFSGGRWSGVNFKPKYDIKPRTSSYMFLGSGIKDIRPKTIGVDFDTSLSTNFHQMFNQAAIEYIGVIDLTSATNISYAFNGNQLVSIEKVVLPVNAALDMSTGFNSCPALRDVEFEGLFPNSNVKFTNSGDLTVDSMKSIISCLRNYGGTNNEFSFQFKLSDNAWERLEASGVSPIGTTWKEYVDDLGWLT